MSRRTSHSIQSYSESMQDPALQGIHLTGEVIETKNSTVAIGIKKSSGMKVAVKFFNHADDARLEFDSMSWVFRRMKGRLRVPEPLFVSESPPVMLTEWVDGHTLAERLVRRGTDVATLLDEIVRVGQWLRKFHALEDIGTGCIDYTPKVRQLHQLHGDVAKSWRRGSFMNALKALLLRDIAELCEQKSQFGTLHGDFKPENIIVRGDTIYVLDFGHIHRAAVVNDVGYFLVQLQWTSLKSMSIRTIGRIVKLRRAFIRGYGDGFDLVGMPLLRWVEHEAQYRVAHKILCKPKVTMTDFLVLTVIFAQVVVGNALGRVARLNKPCDKNEKSM